MMPVTRPVPKNTLATIVSLLVHVPPGVTCERVVVSPTQMLKSPVGGGGTGSTVAIVTVKQPVLILYVIMVVPSDTPQSRPVVEFTVAIVGSKLLQVPPPVVFTSGVQKPIQVLAKPPIGAGNGFTVTMAVSWQPVGAV